jgi:hypothetical protein
MVTGMTVSQFAQSSGGHRRPRPRASSLALALLGVLAVALSAAFVLAPGVLAASTPGGGYAGQEALVTALRTAFVEYWGSGNRNYPPGLERLVDYWIRYHVAKAVIAALLLTVLVVLGVRLWRALLGADRLPPWRGAALASSGVLVTVLAVFSVVLVVANIQGAVAPFASLISMLPLGTPSTQFTHTVGQVKQDLAGYPNAGGRTPPALEAMISDFALYHATLVVLAAIVAVILIGMSVVSWKRRARTGSSERRIRRTLGLAGVLSALLALAVIVVIVANLGTAMNPAPALLAFFNGGTGGL